METAADEQDLAKALDSVADAATTTVPSTTIPNNGGAAGPVVSPFSTSITPAPALDDTIVQKPSPLPDTPSDDPVFKTDEPADNADSGPLAAIKKDALVELRPLVDKLNVSAEEKFDTYLLLIRSTDDANLIAPAHEAAKAIEDETRRAEALLDIIKEIDFLSNQKQDK